MSPDLLGKLTQEIFESFIHDGAVLVGDDDFVELCDQAKGQFTRMVSSDAFTNRTSLQIAGFDVVSNATPGTRGWIIGTKETVERMRSALWASNYYLLFKNTPDGYLYAVKEKP